MIMSYYTNLTDIRNIIDSVADKCDRDRTITAQEGKALFAVSGNDTETISITMSDDTLRVRTAWRDSGDEKKVTIYHLRRDTWLKAFARVYMVMIDK